MWRMLAACLLLLSGCSASTSASGSAGSAPAKPAVVKPTVVAVGDISYPSQLRVGRPGKIGLTLRNSGEMLPKEITVQFSAGYFDGLIVQSTTPPKPRESGLNGGRFFRWDGVAPGEEQAYEFNLVGKTAGEYPFTISLYADSQVIKQAKGKTVVLP